MEEIMDCCEKISELRILNEDMGPPLSPDEEALVKSITTRQELFELPSKEDLEICVVPMTPDVHDENQMLQLITSVTQLSLHLVIDFSRHLPGFDTINRNDQIKLLKRCCSEVMMLRASRRYNIETDSIMFANGQQYTRDLYYRAGVGEMADQLFDFCKKMVHLKVDNAEYAFLTAIAVFTEQPQLSEPKVVEKIQVIYVNTLQKYLKRHRTNGQAMFPLFLSLLSELRTFRYPNLEICFNLMVKNIPLPGLISEILDVGN